MAEDPELIEGLSLMASRAWCLPAIPVICLTDPPNGTTRTDVPCRPEPWRREIRQVSLPSSRKFY